MDDLRPHLVALVTWPEPRLDQRRPVDEDIRLVVRQREDRAGRARRGIKKPPTGQRAPEGVFSPRAAWIVTDAACEAQRSRECTVEPQGPRGPRMRGGPQRSSLHPRASKSCADHCTRREARGGVSSAILLVTGWRSSGWFCPQPGAVGPRRRTDRVPRRPPAIIGGPCLSALTVRRASSGIAARRVGPGSAP